MSISDEHPTSVEALKDKCGRIVSSEEAMEKIAQTMPWAPVRQPRKKTCGNCRHFAKEPNAGGRGCCFLTDDLESYPVKGEHYPFCKAWEKREEDRAEKLAEIVRGKDCALFDSCPMRKGDGTCWCWQARMKHDR